MNGVKQYRKRPVVIEALQFDGTTESAERIVAWTLGVAGFADKQLHIRTLEGDMRADVGDYIIKGVQGEFYPCKPDIFAATYEAVGE